MVSTFSIGLVTTCENSITHWVSTIENRIIKVTLIDKSEVTRKVSYSNDEFDEFDITNTTNPRSVKINL